ncbi:RNA polymerase sigma-70 factor [Pedobacter miscanthi]|uniref:RNA polymerase sigma-70 factor n=1 Tax=Pedobacter miscanthi TaxID=2259170 RepID=A0A366KL62_9SPHI|nr:RNA polymerase sigma-70 factor [Pedobacter miscanthi]RBQ02437.1 RNA polymerase sigma-70 factor [Pedobacter miscanthi]
MAEINKQTDSELLTLIAQGSTDAFKEIHGRYFSDLFRAAYNVLRDQDVCLDIVQEVMLWFWEHRSAHQIKNLRGYLLMAVKYQSANYIRSLKIRDHFPLDNIEDIQDNSGLTIELKELQTIIKSFTSKLPDRCREIFKMSREQHLSNKEIAQKLGISEKTVSVQILRALTKLKSELGNSYFWVSFFV